VLTDLNKIWYADAKRHAQDDELVKIETASRMWQTSDFHAGSGYNSATD